MSDDKWKYSNGLNLDEPVESISFGEPRMVTVRMFDREYHIKSDQPQLVELLADEINREARKLQELSPAKMGPGHFDWPVQVAFSMALARFRCQEAYNSLKAQVESNADSMVARIAATLGDFDDDDDKHGPSF